jgi:hypothetical protein
MVSDKHSSLIPIVKYRQKKFYNIEPRRQSWRNWSLSTLTRSTRRRGGWRGTSRCCRIKSSSLTPFTRSDWRCVPQLSNFSKTTCSIEDTQSLVYCVPNYSFYCYPECSNAECLFSLTTFSKTTLETTLKVLCSLCWTSLYYWYAGCSCAEYLFSLATFSKSTLEVTFKV